MTLNDPDQAEVPTSFAASVLWAGGDVPCPTQAARQRREEARQSREAAQADPSEPPTYWEIEAIKAEARADGYVAGRIDGIKDASAAIISELDEKVANSLVTGTEARAFKSGLTIAKSIVERVANRLALSAKNKQ